VDAGTGDRLDSGAPGLTPFSGFPFLWPASNSRARSRISSARLAIERAGANRWPGLPRRLADHSRVGRVALVAPDIGLHMRVRDQPHFEAERHQLPRPVMGRRTCLQIRRQVRPVCTRANRDRSCNRAAEPRHLQARRKSLRIWIADAKSQVIRDKRCGIGSTVPFTTNTAKILDYD
jgi:hypothetical protein